jgi:hypothetical protein
MGKLMNRKAMERIWNSPRGVRQPNALCRWFKDGDCQAGSPRNPDISKEARAFRDKVLGGKGWPAWSKTVDQNRLYPSAELVARYKKDCPNNWKALVAAFGQTITKYDDPRQFED